MPPNQNPLNDATLAQLAELDAQLVPQAGAWWDGFYADRAKPCPFFEAGPDESLAEWLAANKLGAGTALDLGCGNGRNALVLAQHGFAVQAVDYSATAIAWAEEKAKAASDATGMVTFTCASVFDLQIAPQSYDLVYDSGCFHHMAPHRRAPYVALVRAALKPGGWFGLTCFRPEGGSGLTDQEVYEQKTLGGGLGYSDAQLRAVWGDGPEGFDIHTLRQMRQPDAASGLFGVPFLWVMWAQKR